MSKKIFQGSSIASLAIVAHECGHAIQDKEEYYFLRIRNTLVPFVNISSYLRYVAIVIGILFETMQLFWIGICLLAVILVFQLITLPVEFDASKRALYELENLSVVDNEEKKGAKKVLKAAAFTYVASLTTTLLEILRLALLFFKKMISI